MSGGKCETCGNQYHRMLEVKVENGGSHLFDCFECAIQALAPRCEHCSVPIIGHGAEEKGHVYCSAHCSRAEGRSQLRDSA